MEYRPPIWWVIIHTYGGRMLQAVVRVIALVSKPRPVPRCDPAVGGQKPLRGRACALKVAEAHLGRVNYRSDVIAAPSHLRRRSWDNKHRDCP